MKSRFENHLSCSDAVIHMMNVESTSASPQRMRVNFEFSKHLFRDTMELSIYLSKGKVPNSKNGLEETKILMCVFHKPFLVGVT